MTADTPRVITRSNRGQWENSVEGRPELSRSFTSRDEAIEAGATLAGEAGFTHHVEDAPATGAVTDRAEDRTGAEAPSPTSDEDRMPEGDEDRMPSSDEDRMPEGGA